MSNGQATQNGPPRSPPKIYYAVKSGDTITGIARRFNVTIGEIFAANPGMASRDVTAPFIESHAKDGSGLAPDIIAIPKCQFNPNQNLAAGAVGCKKHIETVCDVVALIKKVEAANPDWTTAEVTAALRKLVGYDTSSFKWAYSYYWTPTLSAGETLSQEDLNLLRATMHHFGDSPAMETGIAYDDRTGEYVSLGHVLTGVSGGIHYDDHVTGASDLNNLYYTTVAGDIGQRAALLTAEGVLALEDQARALDQRANGLDADAAKLEQDAYTVFGPGPTKEAAAALAQARGLRERAKKLRAEAAAKRAEAKQKRTKADMDATPAEYAGDVDGFILGDKIRTGDLKLPESGSALGKILSDYYGCDGRAKAGSQERRAEFKRHASKSELGVQAKGFAPMYLEDALEKEGSTAREVDESLKEFERWLGGW